jgi:hypothetical protein
MAISSKFWTTVAESSFPWERTWDQQRLEDAIDARARLAADHPNHLSEEQAKHEKREQIGDMLPPPKYTNSDLARELRKRL